jgi:SSS family solute:Na+ symporter
VLSALFVGYFIAPKFHKKFKDALTVSDLMRFFFGNQIERLSAIVAFIFGLGVLSTQFMVLGTITKTFLGLDYTTSVLLSAMVLITYSTLGGIWAVAVTDVIQFVLLSTAIPLLCNIMIGNIGGLTNLFSNISYEHKTILDHPNLYEFICLFLFFCTPFHLLQPSAVQRCLIVQDSTEIRKMFYTYGGIKFILILSLSVIALSATVVYQDIEPKNIIDTSVNKFFPPVLKGITISGLLAVIMSTADSHLNASAVLMVNNILKIRSSILIYAKITSFLLGIISLLIALLNLNIIKMIVFLELLYALGIGLPLILAMFNKKLQPGLFYTIFICSFVLVTFFYLLKSEVNFYTPVLVITIITLIGLIYCYLINRKASEK